MAVTVEQAREAWRARDGARRELAHQAAEQARSKLPGLVALLHARGASRVVLFGSLAEGRFGVDSDIDLAVQGMPSSALLGTPHDLTLHAGRRVDVVRLEEAPASLVARIAECGRELP